MPKGRPPLVEPMTRTNIIVTDTAPPIHLDQANAVSRLHRIDQAVILVEAVVDDITRHPAKSGAKRLRDWVQAGAQAATNAPIRIEKTEAQASTANPQIKALSQHRPRPGDCYRRRQVSVDPTA